MIVNIHLLELVIQKKWLCKMKINAALPEFVRISSWTIIYAKDMPEKIERRLMQQTSC